MPSLWSDVTDEEVLRACRALVVEIRERIAADPSTRISTSSDRPCAGWTVDLVGPSRHAPGDVMLRATRHSGRHVVSLFRDPTCAMNPLLRIRDERRIPHALRPPPSREAVLDALDGLLRDTAPDLAAVEDLRARWTRTVGALLAAAGVAGRASTTPPDHRGAFRASGDGRVWTHPLPKPHEGGFSVEAVALLGAFPSTSGLTMRGRRRRDGLLEGSASIEGPREVNLLSPSPLDAMRVLADVPRGARLLEPRARARRR